MVNFRKMWSHVAVAMVYALSYALLREVSFSHWFVLAGFQLSVLILVPYRYWLALAVGETLPVSYTAMTCLPQFGWAWALFEMVPSLPLIMPVVCFCRARLRLLSNGAVNVAVLLLCALAAALIVTGYDVALLSLAPRPPGYPPLHVWAVRYMLGHYLGILTITPLVLSIYEKSAAISWRQRMACIRTHRLVLESIMLLPCLAALVWIGMHAASGSDLRAILQIAMFVPVVGLALRHGWQGAAVGGTAASIGIVLLMPALYDHGTLQAETFIAFTMSSMLLLGKPITVLNRREQQERIRVRQAVALAQRNYHQGEHQLRRVAYVLLDMQRATYRLLQRFTILSPHEAIVHEDQTRPLIRQVEQLTDYAHPLGTRRSLPQALQGGPLLRTLADYGVDFHVHYRGRVSALPQALHLVLYRLVCDGAANLCGQCKVDTIRVCISSRILHGQCWIRLVIEAQMHREDAPSRPWSRRLFWDELLSHLRVLSRDGDFRTMVDTAHTFEGRARQRMTGDISQVVVLLRGPDAFSHFTEQAILVESAT